MANITVHSSGDNGFTPVPYPTSGTVKQDDLVTFRASGDTAVPFYAQSGLFYLSGCSGSTNSRSDQFTAPAANASGDLSLCVAANPSTTTEYKLSLSSTFSAEYDPDDVTTGPSDGTINVGTKPTYDSVTDPRARPRPQGAPGPAMRAQGSD